MSGIIAITGVVFIVTTLFSEVSDDDVTVPPGGYAWAVVSGSGETLQFETVNPAVEGPPAGSSEMLPETVRESILLCPEWIQADLATRFTDLVYRDVCADAPVTPGFADINSDGLKDLVLESASGNRVFLAPLWQETVQFGDSLFAEVTCDVNNDGFPDSSSLSVDGVLTVFSGDSAILVTEGFSIADPAGTALGDVDGDGIADLIAGTEGGSILVFRNRGSVEVPCFLPFYSQSRMEFPINAGPFSSPVVFVSKDSVLAMAVGTGSDGLVFYSSSSDSGFPVRQWSVVNTVQNSTPVSNISPVVVNIGGDNVVVCGSKSGVLYETRIDSDSLEVLHLPRVPGTYPSLTLADVNADGVPDLVAGTRKGNIYYLTGVDGWFAGSWETLQGIPLIPSAAPAGFHGGLVVGSADGNLRYFLQNTTGGWEEAEADSELSSANAGMYSTPCFFDMDNDGVEELVTGDISGRLMLYEENSGGTGFRESYSWEFQSGGGVSSIESYYARYFSPYTVFRSPSGTATASVYASEIADASVQCRDEIAYCIAHTPTHILRAMEEHDDADLFSVNAASLYSMVEDLNYVELQDSDLGTQLSLKTQDGWFEVSRENYYRYVVNPRILFEVPGRVDASYWNTPCDTTAVTQREYLNYEPDSLFGHSPSHVFWREFIPEDRNRALRLSLEDAQTFEEAVIRVCNFQSHSQPEGLMTFGYMTNDLQPMLIYSKAYGSCGEQSILQTALCRTCFIPAYVVGCRGEDHQWNQYLDPASGRWNHWDINYGISGIGNIWVSGEGVNHTGKTISTISAFDPGGRVWPVTCSTVVPAGSGYMEGDSGYTATAGVEVVVTDPAGTPVEGAMVLARSHWNNANSVSVFDYTDPSGSCVFNLGWEPNGGYTIDVVSPFGSAGSRNISFQEGSSYTVNYTVPYFIPEKQEVFAPFPDGTSDVPVIETVYTIPYFTGSLYSINSDAEDAVRSSDWIEWRQTSSNAEVLYMDRANFRRYSGGLNCNAVLAPFVPRQGDSCFAVLDNRNSMFVWRTYKVATLCSQEGSSIPGWLSRSVSARNPVVGLCASGGSFADLHIGVLPVEFYSGRDIFQDDPDDPLSAGLIEGPFRVSSNERSISIQTSSEQAGLDVDLFLFKDANDNRMLDGMEELLDKSTSPSSSETILVSDIDTSAVFWVCVHGWQVPEGLGTVDMGLSFQPEFVPVYSLYPIGFQAALPDTFSFETAEDYSDGDIYLQSDGSVIFPENTDGVWHFEPEHPEEFFADGLVELFRRSGELVDSINWSFAVDSVPPAVSIQSDGVDYFTMKAQIEVQAEDLLSGVEMVTLSVDSLEGIGLSQRSDTVWVCSVDLLPYAGRTVPVCVTAVDSAGNTTVETYSISVVQRPEVVFSSVYPTGTIYDHAPVLQVAAGFRSTHSGWTAVAELYGNGSVCKLAPAIADGSIIQFPVGEQLADGEYTATVDIIGSSGETHGTYHWSFTVGTMSSIR